MVAKGTGEGAAKGDVDVGDLKVIAACCCTMSSLYLEYPGCCGCVQKGEVLCLEGDCKGCKFVDATQNDGRCCILQNGGCYCKSPETCCQQTAQTFCCDSRCALPCTDDVPCVFTLLPFCVVYPSFACCKDLKHIEGAVPAGMQGANGQPGEAPGTSGPV